LNYHDRTEKNALVFAEADNACGSFDEPALKELAYVASDLPVV